VRFLARCLALRPFFCHGFLIEHKRFPYFRGVTFEGQSETAMRLAGQRVNMVAARTDAAKTMAIDAAVAKGQSLFDIFRNVAYGLQWVFFRSPKTVLGQTKMP
jgi:hypothetical protein